MFAAVDDVAGKFSEAEGEFAAEKQKSTDDDEEAAEEEERAAEFAERIHESIIEGGSFERREQTDGTEMESRPILPVRLGISELRQIQSNLKKRSRPF